MNDWRLDKFEKVTNAMNDCCDECNDPAKVEMVRVFYDLWGSQLFKDVHEKPRYARIDVLVCHEINDKERSFYPFTSVSADNIRPRLNVDNDGLCLSIIDRRSHILWGLNFAHVANTTIEKTKYDIGSRHFEQCEIGFRYRDLVDYRLTLVIWND